MRDAGALMLLLVRSCMCETEEDAAEAIFEAMILAAPPQPTHRQPEPTAYGKKSDFDRVLAHAPDVSRRQPEPPPGLDEFEREIMAPTGSLWFAAIVSPTVLVDRAHICALLRYVRRLERDVG